jgi:hypothetical protein
LLAEIQRKRLPERSAHVIHRCRQLAHRLDEALVVLEPHPDGVAG